MMFLIGAIFGFIGLGAFVWLIFHRDPNDRINMLNNADDWRPEDER